MPKSVPKHWANTRSAAFSPSRDDRADKQFWKTQPVPQLGGSSSAPLEEGPIDELKHVKDVKQEPGALPSGFEWSLIDIKNDEQVSSYLYRAKFS